MNLEAKIVDPICIKLGKDSNIIISDENNKEDHHLVPRAMFEGEHYGFVLIIDYNGKQREIIYPTQCKILAVGIEGETLKVFEEGKKFSWRFDKSGKLEHSTYDEFTDEFRMEMNIIIENQIMFNGEPTLMNPINIKIANNPQKSVILKDENIKEDYPLHPGAVLSGVHFGFILIIDTDKGQKEIVYPTQNNLYAVAIEGNCYDDLKVFENGKYHPWLFSYNGKFKQKASYNPYSRRDIKFIEDHYDLNKVNFDDCFTTDGRSK